MWKTETMGDAGKLLQEPFGGIVKIEIDTDFKQKINGLAGGQTYQNVHV